VNTFLSGALTALAFGTTLLAQTVTPPGGSTTTPIVIVQQSFTTGMVGFTTNQTARLNVLNLNALATTTATTSTIPANCSVALQFLDSAGTLVKQTTVTNFAPGAAASFDLPRASVTSETATRAEIRGVVVVNPTETTTTTAGFCTLFTTLEIYDATGSTVSSTSDTRALGIPVVTPLAASVPR
jgi:hypothetical protein